MINIGNDDMEIYEFPYWKPAYLKFMEIYEYLKFMENLIHREVLFCIKKILENYYKNIIKIL